MQMTTTLKMMVMMMMIMSMLMTHVSCVITSSRQSDSSQTSDDVKRSPWIYQQQPQQLAHDTPSRLIPDHLQVFILHTMSQKTRRLLSKRFFWWGMPNWGWGNFLYMARMSQNDTLLEELPRISAYALYIYRN